MNPIFGLMQYLYLSEISLRVCNLFSKEAEISSSTKNDSDSNKAYNEKSFLQKASQTIPLFLVFLAFI